MEFITSGFKEPGGAEEFHPHAPTDPYVTLSRHTLIISRQAQSGRAPWAMLDMTECNGLIECRMK